MIYLKFHVPIIRKSSISQRKNQRMLELFIEGTNNKASSDPAKLAGDTHTQTLVADAHAELDTEQSCLET